MYARFPHVCSYSVPMVTDIVRDDHDTSLTVGRSFLRPYGRDAVCFEYGLLSPKAKLVLASVGGISIPPLLQFPPKPGKKPGPTMTENMARRREECPGGAFSISSHHVGETLED